MKNTPKQLGFTMPAEWKPHSAVWLAWPYDKTTFPNRVKKIEKVYCKIIKALKDSEQVELLVLPTMKNYVKKILKSNKVNLENISFHFTDYCDVWTRDYAPIFLTNRANKKLGWVKTKYNAYGKKEDLYYKPLIKDNGVFNRIIPAGDKFNLDIVLESGSIETNGEEILITTEQCLLNPNRNPHLNKNQIEEYLKNYLGVSKIIWLKEGLMNDHTDGHVDNLIKFISPNKILCCYENNPKDENYDILKNNFETLSKESFEIIKLPMPNVRYDNGAKAPASYVNFYIGNKVILVPTFNDPNDNEALKIIQSSFLNRKVIGIDCCDLIYGGGAIHCITRQQPIVN